MAEDFAGNPGTGIEPVICGDAHPGNFEAEHPALQRAVKSG